MPRVTDTDYLRHPILKITWDDSAAPSVPVPLGDFFGVGHGRTVNFVSAPLQMSPDDGKAFKSWFHMPFARHAKVELISELTTEPGYQTLPHKPFDLPGREGRAPIPRG